MPYEVIIPLLIIPSTIILIFTGIFLNKKAKKKSVDISWLLKILGEGNIIKVEKTNKRISITFNDLKLVDLESLKTKTKGIFIKGNSVVLTFISDHDEIYESLKKIV